jgi:prepilin-type N-terminal cleavage/methylation domain-containing protein
MLNKEKGFTIIEVIIAIFILTVGVLGAFSAIQMIAAFTSNVSSRLAAVYLAQEGIENVRNIRDSNWLEKRDIPGLAWDDSIATTGWETIGKFQRRTAIAKPQPNKIVVSVEVEWSERSGGRVAVETELYNWK